MNIVSFAIGALSIVGLIIIGLTVLGVVKAYQALKQISNANFATNSFINSIHQRIDEVERSIYQHTENMERNLLDRMDHEHRTTKSYIDSRIDKLEKPRQIKAKPTDVNPQITDAVTQKVLIKD